MPHALSNTLTKSIRDTIAVLNTPDYAAYIKHLDRLGNLLHIHARTRHKQDKLTWLENHALPSYYVPNHAFGAFKIAWKDIYEKTEPRRYTLRARANLNKSTRQNIHFALKAIELIAEQQDDAHPIELDAKAFNAITAYRTSTQQRLNIIGQIVAVLISLVCSFTAAAAIGQFVITWFAISTTLANIIAYGAFISTFITNWLSFKKMIPDTLNDIFGKDKLFEGWTTHVNSKTAKQAPLSRLRKILLFFASALVVATGITTGIGSYDFIRGLAYLSAFTWQPVFSLSFAIIYSISSIVLMLKPIISLMKANSIKQLWDDAISNMSYAFDSRNAKNAHKSRTQLAIEKLITYVLFTILSTVTLLSLFVLQVRGTTTLFENILSRITAISSAVPVAIAYAMSITSVLAGKLPYVFNSLQTNVTRVTFAFRHIFLTPPTEETDVLEVITRTIILDSRDQQTANNAAVTRETLLQRYSLFNDRRKPDAARTSPIHMESPQQHRGIEEPRNFL